MPTYNNPVQDPNPPTITVGGVTYTHVGNGIYKDPVTGEVGRIKPSGSPTQQYINGQIVTVPGDGGFDPLPADFQPWNAPGAGSSSRLASDDPRYWDLQYAQLDQDEQQFVRNLAMQKQNNGLDAESSRQQALASLIQSRNRNQIDLASTYGQNAAQAAKFASAPEDTYADLMFRNAIGGATPFGAMSSNPEATNARKTQLEAKFQELFGPTAGALSRAQEFLLAPPPSEFFGPEIRSQLGIPPTPGGALAAGGGGMPAAASPAAPAAANPADTAGALQFIQKVQQDPRGQEGFGRDLIALSNLKAPLPGSWGDGQGNSGYEEPKPFSAGGRISMTDEPGFSPASSEGGTNLNIHEPAIVVGRDSGHIYATLAEPRPDGSRRGEQLIIKPLPSEVDKDKKMKEQGKKFVQSASETLKGFAGGGAINAIPDFSDLFRETRKTLSGLGGAHGGVGFQGGGTGVLPDLRFLAGAPFESLQDDPRLMKQTMAGYRTAEGGAIDPDTFLSTIRKFTPKGIGYNQPKVDFG